MESVFLFNFLFFLDSLYLSFCHSSVFSYLSLHTSLVLVFFALSLCFPPSSSASLPQLWLCYNLLLGSVPVVFPGSLYPS